VDKVSGYLKIDRPQKYSNQVPTLYGFIPRTYSGDLVAGNAGDQADKIRGDGDPIDICVLTEKVISDVPTKIIDRLKHYFLTYKDLPGEERDCYITSVQGIEQTHELIRLAVKDYQHKFANLESILSAL
jgi:inorganic pyrophosphatase